MSCFNINLFALMKEFQCTDKPGFYNLDIKNENEKNPRILSGAQLASLYIDLCQKYPSILTINTCRSRNPILSRFN